MIQIDPGTLLIAKSDLIILVISASALGLGLYRWQQDTAVPSSVSLPAPASSRAATSVVPDPTPAASGTESRPLEPWTEPLVGRPANEGSMSGTTAGVATEPGLTRPDTSGTNAADRNDDTVVGRQVPSADSGSVAPTSSSPDGSELYGRYRVREGDYLQRIAERFGTSVANLRSINGIEGNLILVDQELRYPLPAN